MLQNSRYKRYSGETMGQNDMNELQIFEDIIRGQEMRDEGIVMHDAEMREFEAEIRAQYVDGGFAEIPTDDLEELENKANERWPYNGEVATVSGRLEIIYDEDAELLQGLLSSVAIADADGETIHTVDDDDELRFINVDGVKLRSGGVTIDVEFDQDGRLSNVRLGYAFFLLDDREEEVPLFAQPDQLDRHGYDVPTPAEARVRLERRWPSQLQAIDSILTMPESLPHRLGLISHTLNEELIDDTFRSLVEMYVNEELELDMKMPYMALVKERIDSLEDVENEDSLWHALEIKGAITVFLNAPEVRFSSVTSPVVKKPEAYLFGMTFNDEYGDKPEMVAIPVSNIDRFFSTRASTSLAERALAEMDRALDEDMQTIINHKNEIKFAETEREDDDDDTPEYIRQLEILEETFGRIQKMADEYRMHTFTTPEDANRDANILLQNIQEHLNGTTFSYGAHLMEAMGEEVTVANLRHNLEWSEKDNSLLHGVDPEKPVIALPLGDRVVGTAARLYAVAESTLISENDEGIIFYTPRVVMAITTSEEVGLTVDTEPVLSQLLVRNQAAVPLDSSSDIRLIILDQYRASRGAVQRAQTVYGENSPLMSRIRRIDEALNSENPDEFTNLDPEMISRFSVDLGRVVRRHKKPIEPAADVLEAMFGDRNILAVSDVYSRAQDGSYQIDSDRTGKVHGWRVVDVKPHQSGDEILMFVMSPRDEQYRYIPMSSVTEFRF